MAETGTSAPKDDGGLSTDGVATFTIATWREFHEAIIAESTLTFEVVWRGQKRDFALKPSLERPPAKGDEEELRFLAGRQLARFKIAAAGRRGANPQNIDGKVGEENANDEWWALGQQSGLKTPLLDWTESPFAALFFAFEEDTSAEIKRENERGEEHFRYVYALWPETLRRKYTALLMKRQDEWSKNPEPEPKYDPEDEFGSTMEKWAWEERRKRRLIPPEIRVIRPHTDENLRLLSQGGLFTQAPPGRDIESLIREQFKGEEITTMLKMRIRDDGREQCLTALNRMAINHRTLFPDLHGAGLYTNMFIQTPKY